MFKKYVALSLALLFTIITFTGCGKSPTEVTTAYLDALKAQDFKTAAQYYDGDISKLDLTNRKELNTDAFQSKNVTTLLNKLFSFEYTLSNEKITGDTATVDVTVKTYNFGNVVEESIQEYFKEMFSSILNPPTEEESYAIMEKILMKKMESASFDYVKTASLKLTKGKDGWKIDELNEKDEFINALSGGLMDLANQFKDSFEGVY